MTELILGVEAGELGGLLAAHEKVVLSWLSTDTSNLAAQNRHSFRAKKPSCGEHMFGILWTQAGDGRAARAVRSSGAPRTFAECKAGFVLLGALPGQAGRADLRV